MQLIKKRIYLVTKIMDNQKMKIALDTLKFLNKNSWEEVKLEKIVKKSKHNLRSIKTKDDLLKNINRYFDYLLKKETIKLEKSTPKDMLFEVIMARFDILQSYRKSFIKIYEFLRGRPHKSLIFIPSFLESMLLSANIAQLKVDGLRGRIILKGLFLVYIAIFFVWMGDETQSLEKTMTALDTYLERANKIINKVL